MIDMFLISKQAETESGTYGVSFPRLQYALNLFVNALQICFVSFSQVGLQEIATHFKKPIRPISLTVLVFKIHEHILCNFLNMYITLTLIFMSLSLLTTH
jgi:hypothetical protein